jgi:diamine N-acetyltransferase
MKYNEIRLRAPEPEDLELLYEWENNRDYWIISNTMTPFSRYTLKRYIENSHKSIYETGQVRLMIDLIKEKVTIGTVDIFDFDHFHMRAGVGILIAREEYRRKGYASMALRGLTEYCFNVLKLHQIWCNIIANNTASLELFSNLGFEVTGTRREWIKDEEMYLDEHFLQLFKGNLKL